MIEEAVRTCRHGIRSGQSPFAAVIADRGGRVVAASHNTVRATTDATAHAEVNAIRAACRALARIDLSGHVLFTTCEPCPMCAAAIHWARIEEVAWGASIDDARRAGFHELSLPCSDLYRAGGSEVRTTAGMGADACTALFDEWRRGPAPQPY